MDSPLPDSNALEQGLIVDEREEEDSSVQDHVRQLLQPFVEEDPPSEPIQQEPVLLSPAQIREPARDGHLQHPDCVCEDVVRLFGHTAQTAPPSAAPFTQMPLFPPLRLPYDTKIVRPRCAWRRKRVCRHFYTHHMPRQVHVLITIFLGLLFAAVFAAYLSQVIDQPPLKPIYHGIFIVCLVVTSIAFLHSMARLWIISTHKQPRKFFWRKHSRPRHHRRRHHADRMIPIMIREMPDLTGSPSKAFLPVTPIQVHSGNDEAEVPEQTTERAETVQQPPPAYGRWRGSVRIDPDLMHWQRVEAEQTGPGLTTASPPSYASENAAAQDPVTEPEMVQVGVSRPHLATAQET